MHNIQDHNTAGHSTAAAPARKLYSRCYTPVRRRGTPTTSRHFVNRLVQRSPLYSVDLFCFSCRKAHLLTALRFFFALGFSTHLKLLHLNCTDFDIFLPINLCIWLKNKINNKIITSLRFPLVWQKL